LFGAFGFPNAVEREQLGQKEAAVHLERVPTGLLGSDATAIPARAARCGLGGKARQDGDKGLKQASGSPVITCNGWSDTSVGEARCATSITVLKWGPSSPILEQKRERDAWDKVYIRNRSNNYHENDVI